MDTSSLHAGSTKTDDAESTEPATSSSPAASTDEPDIVDRPQLGSDVAIPGVTSNSGIDPTSPAGGGIATAQAVFECLLGFKVCRVPTQSDSRSLLYANGVKTSRRQDGEGGRKHHSRIGDEKPLWQE